MHSILAEFYEIFTTRFSWYWICLVFYLLKFFCFLSNLFMIHCHWLFYHADDSEFTIWSGGTVSNAAINASISMNTCTLSLHGFQTGPSTLHLALFSGLCTRASCSALPIWYHGWGKFQWLEWKCKALFSNHSLSSLRLLQAILSVSMKTYGNLLYIAKCTTFCAERFAEFGYYWFSGLTWIVYNILE